MSWTIGDSVTITWDSTDLLDPDGNALPVKIELSRTNGSTWETLTTSTPGDGSFDWTVDGSAASQCLIRISDAADATIYDVSDTPFEIVSGETIGDTNGLHVGLMIAI